MTQACAECGGPTVWDDDASSRICTDCGTLSDPSQSLLTDSQHVNPTSQTSGLWDGAAPATLKSFRAGVNWDLSGQGKEARDRKNSYAMAEFINSLAVSINAPGLSPRATSLFNLARSTMGFRWGRKSKLVSGACLAIALREYKRPDSLHDIAYLLDEPFPVLVRNLVSVVSALKLTLTPTDTSTHIPSLLAFLSDLVSADNKPTALPTPLVSQLEGISLRAASNTATSLSTLLARLGPDHTINALPSPPTASALFLLALEAQLRAPLSHISDLATCLAAKCHCSGGVVMSRYKQVQDQVATWIEQVPWLAKYERKGKRAKIGKRLVVAQGLNDVVQFQEEIWRGRLKPSVILDLDDEDGDASDAETTIKPTTIQHPPVEHVIPRAKRQKTTHDPLRDATQFLLHPLSALIPAAGPSPSKATTPMQAVGFHSYHHLFIPPSPPSFQSNRHHPQYSTSISTSAVHTHIQQPTSMSPQDSHTRTLQRLPTLASYILTAPHLPPLLSSNFVPPTRLQLLAAQRGGATEGCIDDDELFAEGELERMVRGPEEAEELRGKLVEAGVWVDLNEGEGEEREKEKKRRKRGKRKRRGRGGVDNGKGEGEGEDEDEEHGKKGRVDLEALARFLQDPVPSSTMDEGGDEKDDMDAMFLGLERFADDGGEQDDDDDKDDDDGEFAPVSRTPPLPWMKTAVNSGGDGDGGVVVAAWRPLSPELRRGGLSAYEEEYD